MARETKAMKAERQEARNHLKTIVKPGDTILCNLKHVSRSGMLREISLHSVVDGSLTWLSGYAARALGDRLGKRDGILIGGCGMDMGFALVYNLSHALYGDGYACLGEPKDGKRCPSNYHTNHRTEERCNGTRVYGDENTPGAGSHCYYDEEFSRSQSKRLYVIEENDVTIVCPTCKGTGYVPNGQGPERFDLVHTDGYALRYSWI